jgi:hypothetical protein
MNGPEHYVRAERCFAESDRAGPSYEDAGLWLELGHGHALLAVAAVLAERSADPQWSAVTRASKVIATASDGRRRPGGFQAAQDAEEAADRAAEAEWGPA